MRIHLGPFEVSSGELVVADPCYELDRETIIMGVLAPAKNGQWQAFSGRVELENWGEACSSLIAHHIDYELGEDDISWVKCPFIVGVDSGQACIFDRAQFRRADPGPGDDVADNPWFEACCAVTEERDAGVLPGGAVSRSGIGDGAYGAYYLTDAQQQVVGVKIIFLRRSDS